MLRWARAPVDLVLQQPGDGVEAPPISLSALHAQVQALAAREPGPTAEDVTASVDAAVAGAIRLLLDGNNSLTQGVAALKARLDAADDLLAGLPQTRKVRSFIMPVVLRWYNGITTSGRVVVGQYCGSSCRARAARARLALPVATSARQY